MLAEQTKYADWVNIHSQEAWHTGGRISGSHDGLIALRDAITAAVLNGSSELLVLACDGESYSLLIHVLDQYDEPTYLLLAGLRNAADTEPTACGYISALPIWDVLSIKKTLRQLADDMGLKHGDVFYAIRIAVTGQTSSLPLFETMETLGRACCLERLRAARTLVLTQLMSTKETDNGN